MGLRVDADELAGFDKRSDDRPLLAAAISVATSTAPFAPLWTGNRRHPPLFEASWPRTSLERPLHGKTATSGRGAICQRPPRSAASRASSEIRQVAWRPLQHSARLHEGLLDDGGVCGSSLAREVGFRQISEPLFGKEVGGADQGSINHDARAGNPVPQFAHIAWPVMVHQGEARLLGDLLRLRALLLRFVEKTPGERQDLIDSFAQRRDREGQHREAEE